MRKRKSYPYVMRGQPKVTAARGTVLDPPDRRVREVHPPRLTLEEVQAILARELRTDPRVRAADRCFRRWAATPTQNYASTGMACIVIIGREGTAAAPLDDAESKIVDAAIRVSPFWASDFVHMWYRSDLTVEEIAEKLAIQRREKVALKRRQSVYEERERVLYYYTGRLHEIGYGLIPKGPEA